jgi:Spy/CpxP family protein refolding chaperone
MKNWRVWVVAAAVCGLGATLAAQPNRGRARGPRQGPDPARLQEQLGIDAEQAEQLQQIKRDQQKAHVRLRADMEIARMELEELLAADAVNEAAVAAKVDEVAKLQTAALQARIDGRLAVRKILSAEQARKLERLRHGRRASRAERRQDQRDRRRGGRRGPGGPLLPEGAPPQPPETGQR